MKSGNMPVMKSAFIDRAKTALVVIDLQEGVAGRQTAPHAADGVVKNAAAIAATFRKNGMPVFLVRVAFLRTVKTCCVPLLTHRGRRKPRRRTGRKLFRRWGRSRATS